MSIAIYTLTSPLHDKKALEEATQAFLSTLTVPFTYRGENFSTWGQSDLDIIFVRTGGTENLFKKRHMETPKTRRPVYLLSWGSNNSLAASMEILSWLRQRETKGEIIHGTPEHISSVIAEKEQIEKARKSILNSSAAIIGSPSDWLIASNIDEEAIKAKIGFYIKVIPIRQVEKAAGKVKLGKEGAEQIYEALKSVIEANGVDAFTIRCFDLLSSLKNTGCLALAKLNAEGYIAGCEGDIPAMLSMLISRAVSGVSGFQANPSRIDTDKGEVVFAHCTIPLNMVERYELDTHFESGIGVGIRGFMKEGPVTVFKLAPDASRFFAEEGKLVENLRESNLCRTQQKIRFNDKGATKYFLTNPIGNHHIIIPGHWKKILTELLA
ncbi:MAG: hypothetical protein IK103_06675 [Bacteroidales bacterium]|nr:hypothetical protein [Bacteroidales bacterium]